MNKKMLAVPVILVAVVPGYPVRPAPVQVIVDGRDRHRCPGGGLFRYRMCRWKSQPQRHATGAAAGLANDSKEWSSFALRDSRSSARAVANANGLE
jgi:hypothetical protein